jgi:hypothetical protein
LIAALGNYLIVHIPVPDRVRPLRRRALAVPPVVAGLRRAEDLAGRA